MTTRRAAEIAELVDRATAWWWVDRPRAERTIDALTAAGPAAVEAVIARADGSVAALWARGWNPSALRHVAGRELGAPHAALAAACAVRDGQGRPALDPRWSAELAALGPQAAAAPTDPVALVRVGVALIALVTGLPSVPTTTPPPVAAAGRSRGAEVSTDASPAPGGLDDRVLARVRALLAKAESTEFTDEAEALTAKAQQLISRHTIDAAVLGAQQGHGETAALRRHLVDDPYAAAKAQLVGAVAKANRCEAVITRAFGWVTLAGEERDLDAVELLATSLLTQATAAMHREGPRRDARGRSRTRSFRWSFLLGFAARVGQRLRDAEQGEAAQAAAGDERVLPVLAAREERARAAIATAFPQMQRRSVSVSHADGWQAGHAAADVADLGAAAKRLR